MLTTHAILFRSVYPWAGQDRATLAPHIAVGKAGKFDLFAHPLDARRAVEYALDKGRNRDAMRERPGEVFGALAYGHPFLENNGRTLMTVHADLARRAGFHIAWENINKTAFLNALTAELRQPCSALDALLAPHVRAGVRPLHSAAAELRNNPSLNPAGHPGSRSGSPSPGP